MFTRSLLLTLTVSVTASAGGIGVRVGNPGWTDDLRPFPGARDGTTLVAGCTERQYSSSADPGHPAALIRAQLAPDGTWRGWSDTDEPTCGAVALALPDGDTIVGGVMEQRLQIGGTSIEQQTPGGHAFVARLDRDGKARWTLASRARDPDWSQPIQLALAPNGDVAIAVWFRKDVDFGLGTQRWRGYDDAFVVVVDGKTGKPRWQSSTREPGRRSLGHLVYAASGDLVVPASVDVGRHRTKLVVTAYTPDGKVRWRTESKGEGTISAHGLAIAPDGDLVIAGAVSGSVTLGAVALRGHGGGAGESDPFVVRMSPTGSPRWAAAWTAGGDGRANAAAFAGDELWIAGDYRRQATIGRETLTTTGSEGAFVAALDARGTVTQVLPVREPVFVDASTLFVDGGDLVLGGQLMEDQPLPGGSQALDVDAFVIRWDRRGPLPRLHRLATPSLPRAAGTPPAIDSGAYGGASYGGASYGGASYGGPQQDR